MGKTELLRRAAIGRIYSVSGPFIDEHETYALASFILDALAGRPIEVRAPMRVLSEAMSRCTNWFRWCLPPVAAEGSALLCFETGGEALELSELAARVAVRVGGHVNRAPISSLTSNHFVGDPQAWSALLARYHLEHLPLDEQIAETGAILLEKCPLSTNVVSV